MTSVGEDELLTRLLDVPAAFNQNSFKSFESAFKDWMQIQKKHQQTERRMLNAWKHSVAVRHLDHAVKEEGG